MSGPETAGSSTVAEADRPEPGADRYTSGPEAGGNSTVAEADRRPLEAGGLDIAQPSSIAGARKLCMESVVLGRSSTTS